MAKLYFTYSAMNAGKSALLLQAAHNYRERGMGVMLWTSGHYREDESAAMGRIRSRIGLEAPAHFYHPATDLHAAISAAKRDDGISAAFFDEAQFLTKAQVWQLAQVADEVGVPVLCYGLRTDFQGELFEGAAALLSLADELREARTICHCGRKATMNLRREETGEAVREGAQVGIEKSAYVPLCRQHWRETMGR